MAKSTEVLAGRADASVKGPPDVFDRTNDVLGADHDVEPDEHRHGDRKPPSSFGVPPEISL